HAHPTATPAPPHQRDAPPRITHPYDNSREKSSDQKLALYIQIGLDCKYSHSNRRNHGNRKKRNGHRRRTTRHRSEHHPVNRGRALRRKLSTRLRMQARHGQCHRSPHTRRTVGVRKHIRADRRSTFLRIGCPRHSRRGNHSPQRRERPRVRTKAHGRLMPSPLRSLRIDDMRWERLHVAAENNNTTIIEILRELIDQYLKENEQLARKTTTQNYSPPKRT